jgi:hypothetical protein
MCRSRFPRRPPNVGGGLDAPRALLPALLAVAPVMWASQDAKLPRTDAESGPMALGSLCSVATGCRASRSVKRSDGVWSASSEGTRLVSSGVSAQCTRADTRARSVSSYKSNQINALAGTFRSAELAARLGHPPGLPTGQRDDYNPSRTGGGRLWKRGTSRASLASSSSLAG